jgi:hypothetical protein
MPTKEIVTIRTKQPFARRPVSANATGAICAVCVILIFAVMATAIHGFLNITFKYKVTIAFVGETEVIYQTNTNLPFERPFTRTVEHGERVEIPAPRKFNHTFDGWYRDAALTKPFDQTRGITRNTNLHPKWLKNSYTTTFIDTRFAMAHPNHKQTFTRQWDQPVQMPVPTVPAEMTQDLQLFGGWTRGEYYQSGSSIIKHPAGTVVTANANTTYYTYWTGGEEASRVHQHRLTATPIDTDALGVTISASEFRNRLDIVYVTGLPTITPMFPQMINTEHPDAFRTLQKLTTTIFELQRLDNFMVLNNEQNAQRAFVGWQLCTNNFDLHAFPDLVINEITNTITFPNGTTMNLISRGGAAVDVGIILNHLKTSAIIDNKTIIQFTAQWGAN